MHNCKCIIANIIDEFQDHSFLYNIKVVGVPEISVDESAASTSKLCLNIFKEMGANVTVNNIDIVHRVPSRNSNGKPKPIVCRFVRRLAKDMVMSVRKDICGVNPATSILFILMLSLPLKLKWKFLVLHQIKHMGYTLVQFVFSSPHAMLYLLL